MNPFLLCLCVTAAAFFGLLAAHWVLRRHTQRYLRGVKCAFPELALTIRQFADIQNGVVLVGSGRARIAMLGFDTLNLNGVGSLVVIVTNGAIFDQTIGPAVQQRFGELRPVS